MKASLLLFAAAALRWCALVQSAVESTSVLVLDCHSNAKHFSAEATYRVWHSVRVRSGNSSFTGFCDLNLNMTSSTRQEPGRWPQLLLLVKVESLLQDSAPVVFYKSLSKSSRDWNILFASRNSDAVYMWVSESVLMSFFIDSLVAEAYEAAFVVTEATNVCGLWNGVGELVVQSRDSSSEYAFASDVRHKTLLPNNLECAAGSEYSLTVRPGVRSAHVTVTAHACPSSDRCAILLLNGRRCKEGESWVSQPPDARITLWYVLKNDCYVTTFAGFVVSARAGASSSTSGAGSWTTAAFTSIGSPDSASGSRALDASGEVGPSTLTVVGASVAATAAAAALFIGITAAFLCHKRRRRPSSTDQAAQTIALHQDQIAASAGDEVITVVDNDLYGVQLARRMTSDRQ